MSLPDVFEPFGYDTTDVPARWPPPRAECCRIGMHRFSERPLVPAIPS